MPLTLDEARAISERAHEHASKLGARVTVAVVDEGGTPQLVPAVDDGLAREQEAQGTTWFLVAREPLPDLRPFSAGS